MSAQPAQTATPGMHQTLDQRRANSAWEAIKKIAGQKGDDEYAGEAKKLPMRIIAAGLGPALAFIRAKKAKKPLLDSLYRDLGAWVLSQPVLKGRASDLLEGIMNQDADFLRMATAETLAWLQWLNRFAEAEVKGKN